MGDVDFLSGLGDQDRDDEDEEGEEERDAEGLDVILSLVFADMTCLMFMFRYAKFDFDGTIFSVGKI
jgi:hypothetical protein